MWTKNQQMVEIRGAHADTNKQITELEAKIAINHDPCPQPGREIPKAIITLEEFLEK